MDHDSLGSRCFQKGDHLGALEHFNKAIKCSSPKLVPNILNKRSLVYIKLEKLQQALRDGREIIKRMPDMAMGYLRCGQVVQLMGQRDKALEILERGLHKVAAGSHGDRKTLAKHYQALRSQSQPTARHDPLTKLPREIVQQLWKLLDMKSRGCCLSVSKGWKKSIESYPPLWQDLEISNNMSATALTAWFQRAERNGYSLRSATISSGDFSQQCRSYLQRVQRRPRLERLELDVLSEEANISGMLPDISQYLRTLVVSMGSWVPISSVKQIMANYRHLEHVEFHAVIKSEARRSWPEMPSLRIIVLQASSRHRLNLLADGVDLEWNGLIKSSPNIKSATIRNWRRAIPPGIVDLASWSKLTYLDISRTVFLSIPTFPRTLTHLAADGVNGLSIELLTNTEEEPFCFPSLQYLSVNDSDFSTVVNEMANRALISGSLTTLDIGGDTCLIQNDDPIRWPQALPAPSTTLETLSLRAQTELSEKTIISILRQYPNLKSIDLGLTGVTGSTLRELFERDNKPDFIDLEGCDDCYYDAVEAAREAGIEVRHDLAPKKKVYKGKRHPTYD